MDEAQIHVLRKQGASIVFKLQLDAIRAHLYSEGLLSRQQYENLFQLSAHGGNLKAAELFVITYLPRAGKVEGKCPFDIFLKILEVSVKESACFSHQDIAKRLKTELNKVRIEKDVGSWRRRDILESTFASGHSRSISSPAVRSVPSRAVLLIGKEAHNMAILKEFAAVDRTCLCQTSQTPPTRYVQFVHESVLYGQMQVFVISIDTGCLTETKGEDYSQEINSRLSPLNICSDSIRGAVIVADPLSSRDIVERELAVGKKLTEMCSSIHVGVMPTYPAETCLKPLLPLLQSCGITSVHPSLKQSLISVLSGVNLLHIPKGVSDCEPQKSTPLHEPHPQEGAPLVNEPYPQEGAPLVNEPHPQEGAPLVHEPHPQEGAPILHEPHPQKGASVELEPHPQEGAPLVHEPHPQEVVPLVHKLHQQEGIQNGPVKAATSTDTLDELEGSYVVITADDVQQEEGLPKVDEAHFYRLVNSLPVDSQTTHNHKNRLSISDFHTRDKSCIVM